GPRPGQRVGARVAGGVDVEERIAIRVGEDGIQSTDRRVEAVVVDPLAGRAGEGVGGRVPRVGQRAAHGLAQGQRRGRVDILKGLEAVGGRAVAGVVVNDQRVRATAGEGGREVVAKVAGRDVLVLRSVERPTRAV